MTQDLASTVVTNRRQLVNGAFETVERVGLTGSDYLEGEIVIVAAYFASSHLDLLEPGSTGAATFQHWQETEAYARA
jgi:hypothetical protein